MGRDLQNLPRTVAPAPVSGVSAVPVLADLVAVLAFVAIGRASHDEGLTLGGLVGTSWPFVAGLIGGYVGVLVTRWPATGLLAGFGIAAKTVLIGLVLRAGVAGDDVPVAFAVTSLLFVTTFLVGWRLLVRLLTPAGPPASPA